MDTPAHTHPQLELLRFAPACELAPELGYLADPSGRVVYVNRRWLEYTGLSVADSLGFAGAEAIHPDDRARVYAAYLPAVDAGRPYACAYRLRARDGAYRWFAGRAEPLPGAGGAVLGWMGVADDLGARHDQVAEEAGIGVWDGDLASGRAVWSAQQERLFGLEPGAYDGSHAAFLALIHPDDRGQVNGALERAADRHGAYEEEFRVLLPGGAVRWLGARGRLHRDAAGRPVRFAGVNFDITARKTQELRLGALQALTAALSQAATPQEVYEAALEQSAVALGTRAGAVTVVGQDGALEIIANQGQPPAVIEAQRRMPPDADHPLAEVARVGRPLYFRSAAERNARYPHLVPLFSPATRSSAFVPMSRAGRNLGILTLSFPDPRPFDEAERAFIAALADACAQALERSRLLEAERLARAQAERSAALLEAMLDHTPAGLAFFDAGLRFERVNARMAEINRVPLAAHLGRTLAEIAPDNPGAAELLEGVLRRVLETGEGVYDREVSGSSITDPADIRHSLASWFPVRLEGRTALVGATVVDITERKRAEEALRASEARLSQVLNQSHIGVVEADAAGRMTLVNRRWCEMLGYSEGELLGMTVLDVTHPDSLEATLAAVGRLAVGGPDFVIEKRYLRRDGSTLEASSSVSARRGPGGEYLGLVAAVLDITARKEAEAAALRDRQRLELGVRVAGLALAEVDYPAGTVALSPGAARLYGLGDGTEALTVSREALHATFHPEERAGLEAAIASMLNPAGPGWFAADHRVVWPDGTARWLSVRKQVFFGAGAGGPRPLRATLAALDITEAKHRELNLAFLAGLRAALAPLADPAQVAAEAGAALVRHLGLAQCLFVEVDEAARTATVFHDSRPDGGAGPLLGAYALADFHTEAERARLAAGDPLVIADVRAAGRGPQAAARFEALGIRALVTAPHLSGGRWRFALSAQCARRTAWRADEAALVGEVAALVYPLLERARAEEALRASEASFRLMADAAPLLVWVADQQGNSLFINRRWYEYSGAPQRATAAEIAAESLHPEDAPRVMAAFGEAMRAGRPFEVEQRNRSAAGEYRWFLNRAEPYRDPRTGEVTRWFGAGVDIHDRKQAEERLRVNQETFERLVENAPFGVYVVDAGFRMALLSRGARRAFAGVEPLDGRDFAEVVRAVWPEPFAAEVIGRFHHTLKTGEPYLSPVTTERRGDAERTESYDWKIERLTLPDGSLGVVCYFYDLTDLRQVEAELLESERQLAEAQRVSKTGSWVWDLQTDRVEWSDQMYELFGLPRPSREGGDRRPHDLLRYIHPADRERVAAVTEEARRVGRPIPTEYRIVTPAGQEKWVSGTGEEVHDASGAVVKLFGTLQDITERKRAEEALRQSEENFRRLAESQKRFVSDAAHELRAPLTAIQGNLELLTRFRDMARADREQALAEVSAEARRLGRLVNDMLSLARGEVGAGLRVVPVRLDEVLSDALETARGLSDRHRLEAGALPPTEVRGDPDRLTQLALQLLENAVKYTPPGGRVRLSLRAAGGYAVFRVADTGIGIAPEDLPRVFERFFRADKARSRAVDGTGLGLSIAKWIAEAHGGEIGLQSELGKGTTAVVRLPLSAPPRRKRP